MQVELNRVDLEKQMMAEDREKMITLERDASAYLGVIRDLNLQLNALKDQLKYIKDDHKYEKENIKVLHLQELAELKATTT